MKLSNDTINILKNFSSINPSILFKEGNVIKTSDADKTIIATATVSEIFPTRAPLYSLQKFLSVCGMYNSPEITFEDRFAVISEGRSQTKYVYADESMIVTPPEKELKFPEPDVSLSITSEDLSKVLKATAVLGSTEVAYVGDGSKCYLKAITDKNPSADTFGIEVGETSDTFKMMIKTENLKLMPMDYEVSLSSKGISRFQNDIVTYYVAVDSRSTYQKGS